MRPHKVTRVNCMLSSSLCIPQKSRTFLSLYKPQSHSKFVKPVSATMKFKHKDQVEVASNEVGFVGSYYEAKVVSQLPGQDYVVEYLTLVEDDFSGPLKEIVTAAEVRPAPPAIPVAGFKLYDLVDAFDNDGWWVGKITRRIGNKYFVYFERSSKDEFAYDFERLRLHQEWVNGKWIIPENTRLL